MTEEIVERHNEMPVATGPLNRRIIICVPTTGLVRIEWVMARYGCVIPCNWASSDLIQYFDTYAPVGFAVAEARNICVDFAVRQKYEWLLFIDHDVILPGDTFVKMNQYMLDGRIPVVSGLYHAKGVPPEPLIYRGRGNSYYKDWKPGDMVWADGIPMGCTLINVGLLAAMHDASEEYTAGGGHKVRKVFETPRDFTVDPKTGLYTAISGTEDLWWCTRVMKEKWLEKCGFDFVKDREFPFLVDTSINCGHITKDGRVFKP